MAKANAPRATAEAAAQDAATAEVVTQAPAGVKARVLTSCAFGNANDVVTVDPLILAASTDVLDANEAAVAYAESLAAAQA